MTNDVPQLVEESSSSVSSEQAMSSMPISHTTMTGSPMLSLFLIFLQSLIATLGSLYYGRYGDPIENYRMGVMFMREFGYPPCELCRFARIVMYPIVVISVLGLVMRDRQALKYSLALAVLGIILEGYQYFIQMTSTTEEIEQGMCGGLTGKSCAAVDVIYQGFITIPFLCLVAFIVIAGIATWGLLRKK